MSARIPKITPAIKAAWKAAPRCPHCDRKAAVEQTMKGLPLAYVCSGDEPRSKVCEAWRQDIPTVAEEMGRGNLGANVIPGSAIAYAEGAPRGRSTGR